MTRFTHPDLARLARVIAALRQGATITLPFIPHSRGSFCEEIRLGAYRPDSEQEEILHRATHRMRSGRETTSRYEPVTWSIDDLMALSADWPAEVIEALPSLDAIDEAPCYALLGRLDAGESVVFSGMHLGLAPREPGDENACRIAITFSHAISAEYTASELATYKPR
jgi:hypothetical protein